jgi:hypothetical protein
MLVGLKARGFRTRGYIAAAPAPLLVVALARPTAAVASGPSAQAIVSSTIACVRASTPAARQVADATKIVTTVASRVMTPRAAPDPAPQASSVVHPAAARAVQPDPSPPPRAVATFHASPPVSLRGGRSSPQNATASRPASSAATKLPRPRRRTVPLQTRQGKAGLAARRPARPAAGGIGASA